MKNFIYVVLFATALFSQENSDSWISGKNGPYAGIDEYRLEKLEKIKTDRIKEQTKLKIEWQKYEIELKELLLGGAELQELWENCRKKGELWAKIQFAQIKADAKRKEILSEKEWENYLIWKLNMEAKKKGYFEYEKKIVKPLKKTDGCDYIVAGTIEYYKKGKLIAVVDYGDGTCDNKATKETGGETYEFEIK
jgi:hypothetical protein